MHELRCTLRCEREDHPKDLVIDGFIAPDGTLYRKKGIQTVNDIVRHIYTPDTHQKRLRKNIVVEDTFFLWERMRKKLELNRERYKKKAATIEPICGDIKHNGKFRRVHLRGIRKVRIEAYILAIAHDMKKFFNFGCDAEKEIERVV